MRKSSSFTTAPVVVDDSNRPLLASTDLSRSYQWPFHLRVHPDRWEYTPYGWRLEIERVHLRPGVGGVGGKERDLNTLNDHKLTERWAEFGDRKWVLVKNGDKRVDANGFSFLDNAQVSVIDNGKLREGSIFLASWEEIDPSGMIVPNEEQLTEIAWTLSKKLFNMDGPSPRAVTAVVRKISAIHDRLTETEAKRPRSSPALQDRIARLRAKLYAITQNEKYAVGETEPVSDIDQFIANLSEADKARLASALLGKKARKAAANV